MSIVARGALILMLLSTRTVEAQIRLQQLPVTLPTQALQNTTQLLDQTQSRVLEHLSDLRLLEIAQLARTNPRKLELDPDGQLIVRSEVVASTPADSAIEQARAAGFTVLRERSLPELGVHVLVLGVPSGLSTKKALRRLRESDPGGTYDYNHIYLGSGDVAAGGAPPAAVAEHSAAGPAPTAGLRLGIVDTGIDAGHPVFAAAAIEHWGCDDQVIPAAHGTAVASLLIGRADAFHGVQPGAALYAADVYCGSAAGGALDALVGAFGWLVRERVPVINVSLVGPKNDMLQIVIARLVAAGFVIVAAVGNDGPAAPPLYPASYPKVVGVTAVDSKHKVLIEAARGPQVMFAAVGADTAAAGVGQGYVAVRGTSFASPIVAALLAGRVREPDPAQADQAISVLEKQAIDLGTAGRDLTYGFGLVGAEFRVDPASLPH